jgi:hypothetical protein
VQVDDDGTTIDAMGRGALRVRVTADAHVLDIVTCHLKSKLLSFPGGFQPRDEGERVRFAAYALDRRAAEAATVRQPVGCTLGVTPRTRTGAGQGRCCATP